MPNLSDEKVKQINRELEEVFMRHLGLSEKPGLSIAYTCELTGFEVVHWFSNVNRMDNLKIMNAAVKSMLSQLN